MRSNVGVLVLLGLTVLLSACIGGGSEDAAGSTDAGTNSSLPPTLPTSSVVASTVATSPTTVTTTESTTTAAPTTTTPTAPTTTAAPATTAAPTTVEVLVIKGGGHQFTSPSGNIACVMSERGASCWIGEKNWTIEQPSGPFCDTSDWGNVVDVTADGATFSCYTDLFWDPSAPALAYGNAVEVGAFRCESARSGVTCRNSAGNGFSVARAAYDVF